MVDDAVPAAVREGDAVVDQPLVPGQLREQAVLRRAAGACCRGLCAVICPEHGSGWSVRGLPVWLCAGLFMLAVDVGFVTLVVISAIAGRGGDGNAGGNLAKTIRMPPGSSIQI